MWVAAGSLAFAIIFMYPMLCELGYLGPGLLGWLDKPPIFAHLTRLPANGDWDSVIARVQAEIAAMFGA